MPFFRETVFGRLLYHTPARQLLERHDGFDARLVLDHVRYDEPRSGRDGGADLEEDASESDGGDEVDGHSHDVGIDTIHVVTFSGEVDPENPRNWSATKRTSIVVVLCCYTTLMYMGASLWSSSVDDAKSFSGTSEVVVQLGTTLFLFGLGIGGMIFSPLTEVPVVGVTTIFSASAVFFIACQLPLVLSNNLPTIMVVRLLTGILASPSVAMGGTVIKAMYTARSQGVPMACWDTATAVASFTGPVMGNYAAQYAGYTWPMWIVLWFSRAGLLLATFCMPETNPDIILYRRARRIRKHTGDAKFLSTREIEYANSSTSQMAKNTLIMPITLNFQEAIVLVLNIYLTLVYSMVFAALESFSTVFIDIYGFNPGQERLTCLGPLVAFLLALAAYSWFYLAYQRGKFDEHDNILPEARLIPAFVSAVACPAGLFWFGWSATAKIHWIMPVIGGSMATGLSSTGLFFSIVNYLPDAYPAVSSTVLAGNCFLRSMIAGLFPLFITPLYRGIGPGWASTIWGVIALLFTPTPFLLYFHGGKIRRKSTRARKDF